MTRYIVSNLFEVLEKSSNGNNGITFIDNNGSSFLSYKELYEKSLGISAYLSKIVNPSKNEIVILLDSNKEFVPIFWSCIAAKIKAVPVAVGSSEEHKLKFFKVWDNLTSPFLVTTKNVFENLENFAEQNGLEGTINDIKNRLIIFDDINDKGVGHVNQIHESDIAFIQYSSGSTGLPKGIILTHRNLLVTTSAFINISNISSEDSFLSWFPLTHDMGLIGWHIVPLLAGLNQVLIETNLFVRRPSLWMDKVSEFKSTILCSPNFGLKHFLSFTKKLNDAEWDLSCVRLIANGAEPISPKLCGEFLSALKKYNLKHMVMSPGYGLAEVGLIASISDYNTNFETIHLDRSKQNVGDKISETDESSPSCLSFVCEGEFVPEIQIKVTDNNGAELPEEHVGHICLKGESVTNGYYNNKAATEQAIKNGWLDTGDLGFLKNNKLFLTGRTKELIIINGYNYYPHDIERVCLSIEELELGRVVAAGSFEESLQQEVLLIFVYFKNDLEKFISLSQKIKEVVMKSVGLNVHKIIPVKKIPKTTSGKVQRFLLLRSYKNGEFDEVLAQIEAFENAKVSRCNVDEITYDKVKNELKTILKKVISADRVDENEALVNYGVDSIRGTELLNLVKDFFSIEFDEFVYMPDMSLKAASEIILNQIRKKEVSSTEQQTEQKPNSLTENYTASSGQVSIYYHYKNHPLSADYNISITCRILNYIDIDKFNEAYNYVLNRHEILRAKFFMTDNLYYKVDEKVYRDIETIESGTIPFADLKSLVKKNNEAPFDIENDSVIRAALYKVEKNSSVFSLNLHHIAGDARSLFVLLKELLTCYNELIENSKVKSLLPNSRLAYSNYVDEELKYLNSDSAEFAKKYWTENLAGISFELNLPSFSKNGKQSKSDSLMIGITRREKGELKNISDFVFMFSIYCFVLHRYTQQKEIIVGIPVSNSMTLSNKEMDEELVGYTINTLPINSELNGSETVSEYLSKMKNRILCALKYQQYPFAKIADDINADRNNSDNLFRTMFTSLPVSSTNRIAALADSSNEEKEIDFGPLRLKPFYISQQETLFDLSMEMVEQNDKNVFRISYDCSKYDRKFIERFAHHYQKAIEEFNSSSSLKLSSIDILSDEEKHLLDSFNDTRKKYQNFKPIVKLIEEQSCRTPNNIAYICDAKEYSYEWVNRKANGVANGLLKSGINKGGFIPVFMKKGIELPLSLLAIMKTGCAFVPIDVEAPTRRLEIIIKDINPKVILTTNEHSAKLSFIDSSKIFILDLDAIDGVEENPSVDISLDDPIYGIYTSGTTGIPKCAINLHKGITNRFKFMDDYFAIDEDRVVFHSANYIFDTSVYQLLWALTQGAKVVIPDSTHKLNLDHMLSLIDRYHVTYIDLVPSVFNTLVEYFESDPDIKNKFKSITHLSIGGEAIVSSFVNRFKRQFQDVKITNIYGPTETAIGVTFYDVKEAANEIPIGKPISNTKIYILDKDMNQLPIGITGEIYIGGECVGAGYLNDQEKTDSVFVDNLFDSSGKFYKTGDLACYLPDGNILFKGRIDEQIKIRGVRIEPDEIRANILKVDFVSDAVVVIKENSNGEAQLAAYVVFKNGYEKCNDLKYELSKSLPEIFIPQYFVSVDEIPLNANGKINKQALLEIGFVNNDFSVDTNSHSTKLLTIWREVLGRENVNVNDKFFNCGGNSLKALLLKIKIQQSYGVELGIENILTNPTVFQLEETLAKLSPTKNIVIPKARQSEYYPLSNQQKRMWLLCNGERNSKAYGIIGVFHITGQLDLSVLRKSWEVLVERHETLRTRYEVIQGEPVQVIKEKGLLDYRDVNTSNINKELKNIIEHENGHVFDLSELPLFKIINISDCKGNTKLLLHFHHIITDGWSTKKLFEELGSIYNALLNNKTPELKNLAVHYKDYSVWCEKELESDNIKEAEKYWMKKLSGELSITSLPYDFDKTKLKNKSAGIKRFSINNKLTGKAREFGNQKEITMFMLLVSAVEIVLSKYTNSEEIVLGTPVSGRNKPELEDQLGLYVNTIVLRNKVEREKKYSEYVQELKEEVLESYKYHDYPYDKLVEEKSASKDGDLFNVFVSYEGIDDKIELNLNGTKTVYEEIGNKVSKFNINVMFKEKFEGIELIIEYAEELYKEERISLFGAHVKKALEEIVNNPQKKIKHLNVLSNDEETKLIKYAYVSEPDKIEWSSVVKQFKETASKNGKRTAVFFKGESLTYKDLDLYSDNIASALIKKGVKEECIVGLLTDKSIDMIVGIMGILKAGAAYLPLDPEHPAERLKMIVKDSECKVLLTNAAKLFENSFSCEFLDINGIKATACNTIQMQELQPSQLAYVIYTSGSTGTPKGVMIEHHSLSNLVKSLREEVYDKYGNGLNVALQASYVFDASIQQIFPALMRGDTLHLIDDETKLDGKLTASYFDNYKIDIADATPTLFDLQLRNGFALDKNSSLKHLLIGGEALNYNLIKRFYSNCKSDSVEITNMYGPTECCVDTVCLTMTKDDCGKDGIVPIGKPMLNTGTYILDETLQLLPEGIAGELYLEGENVGRGYIKNDELTKSKFLESTFNKNEKLYKTGDLCRYSYDGNIIYLGRVDDQIKIRGYRVELGEIENVIERFIKPSKCIVIFDSNENELIAFIEKGNYKNGITEVLFETLREQLPAYMCPTKIVEIEKLPLTSSGKPDRNKLQARIKEYDTISLKKNYEAPQSDVERRLVEIWKRVLGVEDIGITDNFYELGGHSLKSLKIMSTIVKEFGVDVSYRDVLVNPTIKELATVIDTLDKRGYKPIPKIEEKEYYELSHAQKRIWLECELGRSAAYNIVGGFMLSGLLDIGLLRKSFLKLFNRHKSLRTRFMLIEGQPRQVLGESKEPIVNFIDFSSAENPGKLLGEEIKKTALKTLNIFADNLVNFSLIKTEEKEYYLLALLHHIVTDGWSIKIMLNELSDIYNAYKRGCEAELRELNVQYKDYTKWLENVSFVEAKKYWREKLSGKLINTSIPTDFEPPKEKSKAGNIKRFTFNKELTKKIREHAELNEVTVFMFMLSAIEIIIHKYSGSEDIILGTPVSGRNHPDLENQLGLYTNTIVLRNKIHSDQKYTEFLGNLKDEVSESYNYQDYPFDKLMEDIKGRKPDGLFNIFVSHETEEDEIRFHLDEINSKYEEIETGTSKFDVSITFRERKDIIEHVVEYSVDLYKEETIKKFATDIEKVIEEIIDNDEQTIQMINIDYNKEEIETYQKEKGNKKHNARLRSAKYKAPKTPIEKDIAHLWKDVLGIKRSGIEDNFFELGGQSIKALQLVTMLKEKYSINLELKFVFTYQTIIEQAKEIENIVWVSSEKGSNEGEEIVI